MEGDQSRQTKESKVEELRGSTQRGIEEEEKSSSRQNFLRQSPDRRRESTTPRDWLVTRGTDAAFFHCRLQAIITNITTTPLSSPSLPSPPTSCEDVQAFLASFLGSPLVRLFLSRHCPPCPIDGEKKKRPLTQHIPDTGKPHGASRHPKRPGNVSVYAPLTAW